MFETDLYEPIRTYFSHLGYTVDGEVHDIDVLCVQEEEKIVIELKNQLNLKLITQGALRQKLFDQVYLAIWTPKNLRRKEFKDKLYLLKRLGLGLIIVSPKSLEVQVYHDPMMHPIEEYQRRNRMRQKKVIQEFNERRSYINVGGSHHKTIMTSYKEDALIVLDYICKNNQAPLAEIAKNTGIKKSGSILQKNFYGWFKRVDRGIYGMTVLGEKTYQEYQDLIQKITQAKQ